MSTTSPPLLQTPVHTLATVSSTPNTQRSEHGRSESNDDSSVASPSKVSIPSIPFVSVTDNTDQSTNQNTDQNASASASAAEGINVRFAASVPNVPRFGFDAIPVLQTATPERSSATTPRSLGPSISILMDVPSAPVLSSTQMPRTPSVRMEVDAGETFGGRKYQLQTLHPDKHVGRQRRMSARIKPEDLSSVLVDTQTYEVTPLYGAFSDDGFNATYNQDVICTIQNFNEVPGTALFGMFDGHGRVGEDAAKLAKDVIVESLKSGIGISPHQVDNEKMRQVFTEAFLRAQKSSEEAGTSYLLSGATASLAFINGARLTVAHVGDSRVVIGRECFSCHHHQNSSARGNHADITSHLVAVPVTQDHRVGDMLSERERIEKAGGIVSQDPTLPPGEYDDLRIYAKDQVYPGLVTSRTIGDTLAHGIGVISVPDVTTKQLDKYDKVMILATDGVWDILSNQEAINLVSKYSDPTEATNVLVQTCVKGWSNEFDAGDNVSAVVIYLSPMNQTGADESIVCNAKWTWDAICTKKDQNVVPLDRQPSQSQSSTQSQSKSSSQQGQPSSSQNQNHKQSQPQKEKKEQNSKYTESSGKGSHGLKPVHNQEHHNEHKEAPSAKQVVPANRRSGLKSLMCDLL